MHKLINPYVENVRVGDTISYSYGESGEPGHVHRTVKLVDDKSLPRFPTHPGKQDVQDFRDWQSLSFQHENMKIYSISRNRDTDLYLVEGFLVFVSHDKAWRLSDNGPEEISIEGRNLTPLQVVPDDELSKALSLWRDTDPITQNHMLEGFPGIVSDGFVSAMSDLMRETEDMSNRMREAKKLGNG